MASATYNYGFPYPTNSDNVDIPGDIEALAEALDLKVLSIDADITTLQDTSAYSAQVSASIDTAINEYDAQVSASMVVQNSNVSASISDIFNNKQYLFGDIILSPSDSEYATFKLLAENDEWVEFIAEAPTRLSYMGPGEIYIESSTSGPDLYLIGANPRIVVRSTSGNSPVTDYELYSSYGTPETSNIYSLIGSLHLGSSSAGYSGLPMGRIDIIPTVNSASPSDISEYGGRINFDLKMKESGSMDTVLSLEPTATEIYSNLAVSGSTALYGGVSTTNISASGTLNTTGGIYTNFIETTNYAVFGKNISYKNAIAGYTTTATSAGTLTLSASSNYQQFLTGTTTHTVVLPVAATMNLGQSYYINNNSTGVVTVNSSGGNLVASMPANTTAVFTCILASGTTAASWDADFSGTTTVTGTGSMVLATSPTLVTPILGTPQSVTLTNGTGLPISTGVSGLGTGVATFLATPTSANLAAAVTGETGSGSVVFSASPTLTGVPIAPTASINTNSTQIATTEYAYGMERAMEIEIFKDATTITASSAVYTMRVPFAMTLTKIPRAYVTTPSSSGAVAVDINNGASSIFTTTLSVDENEDTSLTAATAAVLNGTVSIVDDGKLTFDIDSAGTGAAGLKVVLYYRRT